MVERKKGKKEKISWKPRRSVMREIRKDEKPRERNQ